MCDPVTSPWPLDLPFGTVVAPSSAEAPELPTRAGMVGSRRWLARAPRESMDGRARVEKGTGHCAQPWEAQMSRPGSGCSGRALPPLASTQKWLLSLFIKGSTSGRSLGHPSSSGLPGLHWGHGAVGCPPCQDPKVFEKAMDSVWPRNEGEVVTVSRIMMTYSPAKRRAWTPAPATLRSSAPTLRAPGSVPESRAAGLSLPGVLGVQSK